MHAYITEYVDYISKADIIVAHNLNFDWKMMEAEYGGKLPYVGKKICTMEVSTPIIKIPSQR
jgi:DNA polymerase III epsilon subunit-like protein